MKTNKLKQQKGTLLRVLQYVKPYRVLVIVSLLCACVSAAAQLLIPILTGNAIDQMIGAGQVNLSGVLVFAVWIAVVAALSAVAQQFLATSNNQIAYNLIPQIGGFNDLGYTSEEMKMQNEGRKMLHDDTIRVACTCVRVPVMRSHSEALTIEFEKAITPDEAREILKTAPGVKLWDEPSEKKYPMPLLTSDQDLVYVGRIRRDLAATDEAFDRSLTLFCCADQIRKGAATNAVQIAEMVFGLVKPAF